MVIDLRLLIVLYALIALIAVIYFSNKYRD